MPAYTEWQITVVSLVKLVYFFVICTFFLIQTLFLHGSLPIQWIAVVSQLPYPSHVNITSMCIYHLSKEPFQ